MGKKFPLKNFSSISGGGRMGRIKGKYTFYKGENNRNFWSNAMKFMVKLGEMGDEN